MDQKFTEKIPCLNFLMTICIVLYHIAPGLSARSTRGAFVYTGWLSLLDTQATIAMSFFFFVTAYLLFRTFTLQTYLPKLRRRVVSLFLPYLLWQLPSFLEKYHNIGFTSLSDYLHRLFLLDTSLNEPTWYLYAVFLLAVLSPLLYLLLRRRRIGGGVVIATALWVCISSEANLPFVDVLRSYGVLSNIYTYLPAYFLGAYFGMHKAELSETRAMQYWLILLLLSVAANCFLSGILLRIILRTLPLILLCVADIPEKLRNLKLYRLSFLVYVMHIPILTIASEPIAGVLRSWLASTILCDWSIRLVLLALVFFLAAIVYLPLKKFAPKLLGLLTGGRS